MIRKIVFYPDPVLRKVGEPVTEVTDDIRELASDMLETMYDANGVGLAAQQVGKVPQFIVDVSHDPECISFSVNGEDTPLEEVSPLIFINLELELLGTKDTDVEGCLSFRSS